MPKVSVIMPVYNAEKYVRKSIDSVLSQTLEDLELIVVNDGSTDGSEAVVRSVQDPRVKVLSQSNKGVKRLAETINAGLALATGTYVTMMPSDDLWPDYRLKEQVEMMDNQPNVVLCFGKQKLINTKDEVIGETNPPKQIELIANKKRGSALREMFVWNYIPQPTVLIRKSALDSIGGYLQPEGLYAEDYPTQMELAKLGEFLYVPRIYAFYRLHPNQMTRTHYFVMVQTDVEFVRAFYQGLSEELRVNSGWTPEALEVMLKQRLHGANFTVGRQQLLKGDFAGARQSFVKSLRHGNGLARAKSAIGLFCALTRTDLEKFTVLGSRSARID
jgi:glycosyltransferase involved in cell wall biosynthesis